MGHLLIVIMAMCKGGAIISYIEPDKRAPYKAFIGAFRDISVDEVARGFSAFYGNYTNMLDFVEGMKAIDLEIDGVNSAKKTFWCFSAETMFDSTFNPDRDPENLNQMVEEQLRNHISRGEMHVSRTQVENQIRNILKESSAKHRDYYCFNDIYGK